MAVPGEIKGYWILYKKYGGNVPWKDLFKPTIKFCREGVTIDKYLGFSIRKHEEEIRRQPSIKYVYTRNKHECF